MYNLSANKQRGDVRLLRVNKTAAAVCPSVFYFLDTALGTIMHTGQKSHILIQTTTFLWTTPKVVPHPITEGNRVKKRVTKWTSDYNAVYCDAWLSAGIGHSHLIIYQQAGLLLTVNKSF